MLKISTKVNFEVSVPTLLKFSCGTQDTVFVFLVIKLFSRQIFGEKDFFACIRERYTFCRGLSATKIWFAHSFFCSFHHGHHLHLALVMKADDSALFTKRAKKTEPRFVCKQKELMRWTVGRNDYLVDEIYRRDFLNAVFRLTKRNSAWRSSALHCFGEHYRKFLFKTAFVCVLTSPTI